jgi:hypothetical protein
MKWRWLIFIVLLASSAFGQSWTNILSPSRAISWTNSGLPSIALPDGETAANPWTPPVRTQCGSTINPSGDQTNGTDVVNINAAIAACTAGHYVLLAAGDFYITNHLNCYGGTYTCIAFFNASTGTTPYDGVTLRGSGAQSTILHYGTLSAIELSISSTNPTCTWSGGLSAGSTSITLTSCSASLSANTLITLNQCDTGWSGATCATGSYSDNGGVWVCKISASCAQQNLGGTHNMQQQQVWVTNVSGTCTSSCTVTLASPGVYLPNWSSGNTPVAFWPQFQTYGDAVEDLTVVAATNATPTYLIDINTSYASWIKGVRFIGSGNNAPFGIQGSKNILLINNYVFSTLGLTFAVPPPGWQTDTTSDSLEINNISNLAVPWEGNGGQSGIVLAFNYARDSSPLTNELLMFDHTGGSMFRLYEGNQIGGLLEDDTWGTHNLNTSFRNYVPGWDNPYPSSHPHAIMTDDWQRFNNAVGNSIGSAYITGYQTTSGADAYAYRFLGSDALTQASFLRWGNCDTGTNTCRFQSSEIPNSTNMPSGTYPNAAAYQNSTPGTNNLPCSFFLSTYTSTTCTPTYAGGTGLSFWKVCKSWATFPTSCSATQLQPFPVAGPDITSGPYVNGTAYDNPAAIAFATLPVDTAYQTAYTITASSWSAGTETLSVSGLPGSINGLMGSFQFGAGINAACVPSSTPIIGASGNPNSEGYITSATTSTISYALGSSSPDNGSSNHCTGGTWLFPDVRQFDERVYESDPIIISGTGVINGGNLKVQGTVKTQ